MIRFIEELSLNAWPSLQTTHYDGWILRFAERYTRRANSINPIYASSIDPLEKIKYCEQVYTRQGQSTIFKITPDVQPGNLDMLLAEQGYAQDALTSVQTLALDVIETPQTDGITIETQLTNHWLDTFCRLNNVDSRYVSTMIRMLNNIMPTRCFIGLQHDNKTVAVGLAVVERGYVGLFDIVTAAPYRKQGFGTQLILHLLQWGKANGAYHAYLQVMCNNPPALRLYEKLGFREVYQYWYRAKTG